MVQKMPQKPPKMGGKSGQKWDSNVTPGPTKMLGSAKFRSRDRKVDIRKLFPGDIAPILPTSAFTSRGSKTFLDSFWIINFFQNILGILFEILPGFRGSTFGPPLGRLGTPNLAQKWHQNMASGRRRGPELFGNSVAARCTRRIFC